MLSKLQTRKLTRYFRVYDVDDDGAIGPSDFERVVENVRVLHGLDDASAGHQALRQSYVLRWQALAAHADVDQDGAVDLGEWLGYWKDVLANPTRYEEEVAAMSATLFDIFDTDEDGVIGADEFCNFYSAYGLSAALARQVFMDLDANGDGQVSRDELLAMGREFYRSDDPEAPGNRLFGPIDD